MYHLRLEFVRRIAEVLVGRDMPLERAGGCGSGAGSSRALRFLAQMEANQRTAPLGLRELKVLRSEHVSPRREDRTVQSFRDGRSELSEYDLPKKIERNGTFEFPDFDHFSTRRY